MGLRAFALSVLVTAAAQVPLQAQLTQPIDGTMDEFRWRSIGPTNMGGRVPDVEGLPSSSKTFYVAGAHAVAHGRTGRGMKGTSSPFDEGAFLERLIEGR